MKEKTVEVVASKDPEVGAFVRRYRLTSVVAKVRMERRCFCFMHYIHIHWIMFLVIYAYIIASLNLTFFVRSEWCSFSSHRLFHYFYWLLLTNTWTFSFDISSKFGLRFTIATNLLGSLSLNLSKAISYSILLFQFCVFKGILLNASKQ